MNTSILKNQLSAGYFVTEAKPQTFFALVDLINKLCDDSDYSTDIDSVTTEMVAIFDLLDYEAQTLRQSFNTLLEGVRTATKQKNPFEELAVENNDDVLKDFSHTDGNNFIRLVLSVITDLLAAHQYLITTAKNMKVEPIPLFSRKLIAHTFEDLQIFSVQYNMYSGNVNSFVNSILAAEDCLRIIVSVGFKILNSLEEYYKTLNHRHSIEGVVIQRDPIITDIAIALYENIDSSGEIRDGKNKEEVSLYTIRKAEMLTAAIKAGLLNTFVQNADELVKFISAELNKLWQAGVQLSSYASKFADDIRKITKSNKRSFIPRHDKFEQAVLCIKDVNPNNVVYKEKTGLLTTEERHELEFRNETLRLIAEHIANESPTTELINCVLERKQKLREYHLEENSFFVCKISAGNPFFGQAPGELVIVPGIKPAVNLEDVRGSGFKEVIEFMDHTMDGVKWFDVFLATSPSKKADKNNVLLIGPAGCGKTQVLRAIASNRNSVGIFAQASDFLTCWKGEAEKNPKRLFEGGLKIQKESKKQVFFLIDEIDTILNSDQGQNAFGGINLATEFQVLMDGITSYPNLAVWGATNHLERIPTPLIRRFSKVVIVGELSHEDRISLLKQFLSFMPCSDEFDDEIFDKASLSLRGAVGDIIRKIIDDIWRDKMSRFVSKYPNEADNVLQLLNSDGQKFDPRKFSNETRQEMFKIMRPCIEVKPEDLVISIQSHLANIAIQTEIRTAVATYENARQFLANLNGL